MSRKRKIWVVVSLAVAFLLLIPLGLRWQAEWQLNSFRKKLIAAGEKLTVEELAPQFSPQATNAARFLKLASKIQPFWQSEPTVMLPIKPGVARVSWRQPQLLEKTGAGPATDVWPDLIAAVKTNEQTLDELRTLVDAGGIELIEDYSQANLIGFATFLSMEKQSVSELRTRAILAFHQGHVQEALAYLEACDRASQLAAKNPLLIDQLVTYACIAIAAGGCWEALQASGWTDGQLAQLQQQWNQSEILSAAAAGMAMERARAPMAFEAARSSRQGLVDMLGGNSGPKSSGEVWNDFLVNSRNGGRGLFSSLIATYPRYYGWKWIWSYRDEQRYLEFMQTMIDSARAAEKRQALLGLPVLKVSGVPLQETENTANWNVLDSMSNGIKKFVQRALRSQTLVNMVAAAIALERFRLAHHAYPAGLAGLVPDFLPAVPIDCMDGRDLRYRLNPDGTYLLYSVGDDGVDNGGDPTPEKDKSMYFLNGRDWVWPRAATDEEVQAYEAEQNKPKAGTKR